MGLSQVTCLGWCSSCSQPDHTSSRLPCSVLGNRQPAVPPDSSFLLPCALPTHLHLLVGYTPSLTFCTRSNPHSHIFRVHTYFLSSLPIAINFLLVRLFDRCLSSLDSKFHKGRGDISFHLPSSPPCPKHRAGIEHCLLNNWTNKLLWRCGAFSMCHVLWIECSIGLGPSLSLCLTSGQSYFSFFHALSIVGMGCIIVRERMSVVINLSSHLVLDGTVSVVTKASMFIKNSKEVG